MWTRRVRLVDDVGVAGWIAPRLTGGWGTVTGVVPAGFAADARVLHPAATDDGAPVTWAAVAAVTGGRVHPTVQSPSLVWPADRAWCVATDVDLDPTVVGGDHATVGAVVAAAGLEALRIDPDASLQWGADHLNTRSGRP